MPWLRQRLATGLVDELTAGHVGLEVVANLPLGVRRGSGRQSDPSQAGRRDS